MTKFFMGLAIISISGLMFSGCANQPKTLEESMYQKSPEEAAQLTLKVVKFPVKYRNGRVLENVELDSSDKGMVVYHYKETKLTPKAGKENIFLGLKETLNDSSYKKSIANVCDRLYPYFQTGAKNKYVFTWSNGKKYQEYVVSKEVCDNLE